MMSDDIEQTIVQSLVDDQKRGRVLSIFIMARRGIESLGSRLFGIVANWVGTPDALVIGGTACSRWRPSPPSFSSIRSASALSRKYCQNIAGQLMT
jgi:hypothetical protein